MANTPTKKDYKSDQDVRWCPGCGDYAILNAVQSVFAELGLDRSKTVVVSGIGCSSRFPYYMSTYGFHTVHGRAPGVATGLKLANPDLDVWMITGDGDALSIGGNHFMHLLRRNPGIKVLLFNNRIYGLTKGQYSPTSELGKVTKSTPLGSSDEPLRPVSIALGAGATFVARSVDVLGPHLKETLHQAAKHEGTAFVEIFQNCNIFNDGAFAHLTDRELRADNLVELREGKPLVFGKEGDKGLRLSGFDLEAGRLGVDFGLDDCLHWDPTMRNPGLAFALSQIEGGGLPTPIGVFRRVQRPAFETLIHDQIAQARKEKGKGRLASLLSGGDSWTV